MGIRWQIGSGVPRVLADGTSVIPRFTYSAVRDGEGPRLEVEMEVEVDDLGRAHCVGLTVTSPVPPETLQVPVPTLLRQAAARSASLMAFDRRTEDGGAAFEVLSGDELAATYRAGWRRGRPPRTGAVDLLEVASVWRAAQSRGENPAEAVSEEFCIARGTAYNKISQARKSGLLDQRL